MTTDDQFDQLKQYFIILTDAHLKSEYGEEQGKILSANFSRRFEELLIANSSLMPDFLSKRHGINPVFVMALQDALNDPPVDHETLKRHVISIYQTMLKDYLVKRTENNEASDEAWQSVVDSIKMGNKQTYENEYFQLEVVEDDSQNFGFDINRCIYFEIFEKNGRPELGPILCEYDYIISESIAQWAKFDRKETIAHGSKRCTFRYYRVDT